MMSARVPGGSLPGGYKSKRSTGGRFINMVDCLKFQILIFKSVLPLYFTFIVRLALEIASFIGFGF